jgi:hypothetical protein
MYTALIAAVTIRFQLHAMCSELLQLVLLLLLLLQLLQLVQLLIVWRTIVSC